MSPLRMRMIEDMMLSGLSPGTQATYVDAVRKLAAHYRRSPDQLSEEEVRAYIVSLRERGVARGTFKTNYYGIQYLYRSTLNRDWALFSKKNDPSAEAEAVAARALPRRGPPAAWLHNEPDPQNLLCRHVRLRSADRRGGNP
jgi:hypothetical protein